MRADDHDVIYLGLYNQAEDVADILDAAGLTLTIDPPIVVEEETPAAEEEEETPAEEDEPKEADESDAAGEENGDANWRRKASR